jgi:hypothetical protein
LPHFISLSIFTAKAHHSFPVSGFFPSEMQSLTNDIVSEPEAFVFQVLQDGGHFNYPKGCNNNALRLRISGAPRRRPFHRSAALVSQ